MHVRGRVHPGLSQARGPRRGNPAVQTDRHHRAVQILLDAPRCEMSDTRPSDRYTEYHPRWYRTRVSTWWWLARWPYLKFILREISSVFVAWFVVVVQRVRCLCSLRHTGAPFPPRACVSLGMDSRSRLPIFARAGHVAAHQNLSVCTVFPGAVSLGASISLHAIRWLADQAPE